MAISNRGEMGVGGGTGRGSGGGNVKTPKVNSTEALKKSGLAKLTKLNKSTSEAHILSAVKQGKITAKEAAAINPEKFGILVNPKIVSSRTIKLK
jgi:hypothetical protein